MELEDTLLMMPGPVPVAPRVLRAMSKPMINHRSSEFAAVYDDCRNIMADVFKTKNDIFVISGSGSAGMEAAVGCTVGSQDTVVALENGKFGERFKNIAARYGKVNAVKAEWGHSFDLGEVEKKLEEGAKVLTLVHNETSTGILNPAKEIGKLTKKHDALFIMDGITSIGGDDDSPGFHVLLDIVTADTLWRLHCRNRIGVPGFPFKIREHLDIKSLHGCTHCISFCDVTIDPCFHTFFLNNVKGFLECKEQRDCRSIWGLGAILIRTLLVCLKIKIVWHPVHALHRFKSAFVHRHHSEPRRSSYAFLGAGHSNEIGRAHV